MAELLVVSQDRNVPDSGARWRKGEVVVARPDGWEWGTEELNSDKFIIVELPGVDVADVEDFLEADTDEDFLPITVKDKVPNLHRRRRCLNDAVVQAGRRGSNNRTRRSHSQLRSQFKDRKQRRKDKLDKKPTWPVFDGGRQV